MKKFSTLLIMIIGLSPFAGIAQSLSDIPMPSANYGDNTSVLKITPTDQGIRAFITTDHTVKVNAEASYNLCRLHVIDYDGSHKITEHNKYIMSGPVVASGEVYREGSNELGRKDDVRNYPQIVEAYPELADVHYIDKYNKVWPATIYDNSIKAGLFKPKIKGFNVRKSVAVPIDSKTSEEKPKKKKKGMLGKLASSALGIQAPRESGMDTKYESVTRTLHNWEDSYNGGQDKKNYWANYAQISSQRTGHVVAFNGQKIKGQDMNEYYNKEIVTFDAEGNLISKSEFITEEAWETVKSANQLISDPVKGNDIAFMSIVSKQKHSKKKNPNANKQQAQILAISGDGSVKYNHTYDLPMEFKRLDTLITTDRGQTIAMGTMDKTDNKFVLISDETGQKTHYLNLGKKEASRIPYEFFSNQSGNYAVYNRYDADKRNLAFFIYPLDNEEMTDPIILDTQIKDMSSAHFEVLVNDNENTYVMTRMNAKGINDFKWEMAMPHIYKIEGNNAIEVTNFSSDQLTLDSNPADFDTQAYKAEGGYYFIGRKFAFDDKNKLRNGIKLIKLQP